MTTRCKRFRPADTICGIQVPDPDLGDLQEAATHILESLPVVGDVIEKTTAVRELSARGAKTAGNCWGVTDRAADVESAILAKTKDIGPLFDPLNHPVEAFSLFTKASLDTCVQVIFDILDFGKLIRKLMGLLQGVKNVFNSITEAGQAVVDGIGEWLSGMVDTFVTAMGFGGVLDGITDFFGQVGTLIEELTAIGGALKPILMSWQQASWISAAFDATTHFGEVKDGLSRVMPAWKTARELYATCVQYSRACNVSARGAWEVCRDVVAQLGDKMGIPVPCGLGARICDIRPSVAPRDGLPPEDEEGADLECGEARTRALELGGEDEEGPPAKRARTDPEG